MQLMWFALFHKNLMTWKEGESTRFDRFCRNLVIDFTE